MIWPFANKRAALFKQRWRQVVLQEQQSWAYCAKPTFKQRFWRGLGYRFHLGEEPDDAFTQQCKGWIRTTTYLHFGLLDRLRLLFVGRLNVQHTIHTDTPTPTKTYTRMDWQIMPPRS